MGIRFFGVKWHNFCKKPGTALGLGERSISVTEIFIAINIIGLAIQLYLSNIYVIIYLLCA